MLDWPNILSSGNNFVKHLTTLFVHNIFCLSAMMNERFF